MKAIAVTPGKPGMVIVDRQEPVIHAPDDIKVRMLLVGICGTDKEEIKGNRFKLSPGEQNLVIGHEMFGVVENVGTAVKKFKKGDYIAFTVRRGCGHCVSCNMNRPDMCTTGDYTERGIWGRDGYQTEFVVDKEQYAVKIPDAIQDRGVLIEPLSVAEKAIDEAIKIQSARLPYYNSQENVIGGKNILVAGLGPIGLLASFILRLKGANVYGLDIVDKHSIRAMLLESIGGKYIDGRVNTPVQIQKNVGKMDMIFEATGIASLEFNLLDTLGINGIYVLTGIPSGDRPIRIDGAEIIRSLVLNNQVLIGSVNASHAHFQMAADDLLKFNQMYKNEMDKIITSRIDYNNIKDAISHDDQNQIKIVVEWMQ